MNREYGSEMPGDKVGGSLDRYHTMSVEEVLDLMHTHKETGLSSEESQRRIREYGPNRIEKEKGPSSLSILISQFNNALIVILLIATVLSFALGEAVDAVVIIMIVILVAAIGFSQERKTEKVLSALKNMQNTSVSVVRDGKPMEIDIDQIVPGDVVSVAAGDKISADMRMLESYNILVNEAALTGESTQVLKSTLKLEQDTPVADRTNMLYSGTSVTDGRGTAVVIATGMNTELGKIADKVIDRSLNTTSNLEKRMNEIGKKIGIVVLLVAVILVAATLAEKYYLTGTVTLDDVIAMLLFGVALAVAAIPEALPAVLTGSLAIGAYKMAKEQALIRNISAVETLGSTQVIGTDKTGTLTKGEMTVTEIRTSDRILSVSGTGYEPLGEIKDITTETAVRINDKMAMGMILCNDATLKSDAGQRWTVNGDSTEGALIVLAEKAGYSQNEVREKTPRVWEIPFSSETRRMITVNRTESGERIAFMKGAPEAVIEKCTDMDTISGNQTIGENERNKLLEAAEFMASRALRVMAIATKHVDELEENTSDMENNYVFLGLVGMIDPPRPEAMDAIKKAKKVGIHLVMITGDHKTTAMAIGSQMGIYREGDLSLTGKQLQEMDDQEYERIVENVTVYARVTPFDKLRIVSAWQKRDRLVAMTGDGVNDAPALKKADIGISMGITGTEVAKEASDMILLDDNFATIIKAIALGRNVQDNVKKYLAFLLSTNLVEIVVLSLGVLLSFLFAGNTLSELFVPLLAVQILFINLVGDGFPALEIGVSPPEPDLMDRPVQERGMSRTFGPEVKRFIYLSLVVEAPMLFLIYLTGLSGGIDEARTRLFLAIISAELAISLTFGSMRYSIFKIRPHKGLTISVIAEIFLVPILILIPYTRDALQILYPTIIDIVWAIIAGAVSLAYVEIFKHYVRKKAAYR